MFLSPFDSKIDRVQLLLTELQNRRDSLSTETQDSISTELERFAVQAAGWLQENDGQSKLREPLPPPAGNIPEQKQIEDALRESVARERARVMELQALMDAVPALIWISRDPECKEMVGNRYGYEFLDMWAGANISKTAPETDLVQQPYRNFKDGREIPAGELPMQIAASTGVGASNYEFDLVFKNGVVKNLLGNVLPLTDQDGKPAGAVAVFVDITERKRVENELRESEHRFRVALASVPMTVFTMDKDLRYTWVYNVRHNWTAEEMLGRRDDEILGPEDAAELVGLKQSVVVTGHAAQREIKIRIKGEWFYYIVALDPVFDQHSQIVELIGSAFDVTAQRRLEAVQRKNEIQMAAQRHTLQSREEERINIARDIHDGPIQTLAGMILSIYNLKERVTNPAMIAGLEPFEAGLKQAVQELRQVVNELRPPDLASSGLVDAIRDHTHDICKKLPELDLSLDLAEGANHLPDEIRLVFYRVCQEALQNVIRHARATKVAVQLALDNEQVTLLVKDNGVGFSVTSDFAGLAAEKHYGLIGMKERLETIGGRLEVASKPGAGTQIRAEVPL